MKKKKTHTRTNGSEKRAAAKAERLTASPYITLPLNAVSPNAVTPTPTPTAGYAMPDEVMYNLMDRGGEPIDNPPIP